MNQSIATVGAPAPSAWRLRIALLFFVVGVLAPVLGLLSRWLNVSEGPDRVLSRLLLFGVPQIMLVGVIAAAGRQGLAQMSASLAGQRAAAALLKSVGRARYLVGLLLSMVPVLFGLLEPVLARHVPAVALHRVAIGALCDLVLLIGLLVLGGEFWDKVHALFVHDAKVVQSVAVEASRQAAAPVQVGARFYIGAAIFAMGFLIWGLVPLASAAGWSGAKIASLTGGVFVANKVGMLVAIAVMGKPGFNHLKRLLFGLLRRVGPPARVSRNRYRVGIVLFALAIALSWVKPYAFGLDAGGLYELVAHVPLTLLLLVSVFVLGGDFWDKLGALFRYRTKVAFPDDGASLGRHLP